MIFLKRLELKGFKSIRELKLELRSLNVLIGANGAGKSNLLSFFELTQAVVDGRLATFVSLQGGASRILHHGTKTTPAISFDLEFGEENNKQNGYQLQLAANAVDGVTPLHEVARFWDKKTYPDRPWYDDPLAPSPTEAAVSQKSAVRTAGYVRDHLQLVRRFHFHDTSSASPLRKSSDIHDNRGLRHDGANLASFLLLLQSKYPVEFELIQKHLRRVAPFVRELVLEPLALTPELTRIRWRHAESDTDFDVAALSDGTLRFLALAAVLLQPETSLVPALSRPRLVIIDEPELGLHPFAIRILAALLREAAHDRQVIIATQSSLLLDEFEAEEVVVTEQKDGASTFTRLSSTVLRDWLDEYSLGELWEKNELGGRPT